MDPGDFELFLLFSVVSSLLLILSRIGDGRGERRARGVRLGGWGTWGDGSRVGAAVAMGKMALLVIA